MSSLTNKHILLGVTGGIAAYKSAELIRQLRAHGCDVRVAMSAAATQFITPLTLQALSGHPVHRHLLDPNSEASMGHITLARWADAVLVAPASADFMAKLAHGLADDLLSTLCLASDAPLALAPAMNQQMWANPATQANRATLEQRGVHLFGPAEGEQACGEVGPGRMLEPAELVQRTAALFKNELLSGAQVLVSAGPTREALDPVRYLSNRSSGKMGYALAAAAAEAGARVTLVSGPTALPAPDRVERIDVLSARDMQQAVLARAPHCDIFIAAAAVADYGVTDAAPHKIKKNAEELTLHLTRNPDILAEVARLTRRPFTVGFAAETEHLETHAQHKLADKALDMVAANWVNQEGVGFDSDDNALHVVWEGGEQALPRTSKNKLARELIKIIARRYHARSAA
ncbi:MAG: bifunctional phosphopantothenoylcysteine decarboxylase/phosphopantothenate--cysteine ligase CoaBC [Pseudomonadota bacterium]